MEALEKLDLLTAAAEFDVCGYSGMRNSSSSPLRFIHRVTVPGKGSVCLLKILMTNECTNDCIYCVNQIGRDIPRSAFQPEELAKLFMEIYTRGLAHGLFLSSGIAQNASRTMAAMIDTVAILRHQYEFKGYIHLKILPGTSWDCIEEGCKLANRVSINVEAPTARHLARLSIKKNLHRDIVERMRWVKQIAQTRDGLLPSGQTTQFVVGAADEEDGELLGTMNALYQEIGLKRIYFSAFQPIRRSRSESLQPTQPLRVHRLYQADWLLRVYGFASREVELALDEKNNLPLRKDPKLAIAQKQPWLFPVDINKANYHELIHVPGIGPVSAQRIMDTRHEHSIFALNQLKRMGVITKRATPFIRFQGMSIQERQMSFLPQLAEEQGEMSPSLVGAIS